jgi:hypothetical protein
LQSGQHHLRLRITKSQFNINWFEFSIITSVNEPRQLDSLKLFPNPGRNQFYLQGNIGGLNAIGFDVYNSIGRKVLNRIIEYGSQINETINMGGMPDGVYFIVIRFKDGSSGMKRMIKLSN